MTNKKFNELILVLNEKELNFLLKNDDYLFKLAKRPDDCVDIETIKKYIEKGAIKNINESVNVKTIEDWNHWHDMILEKIPTISYEYAMEHWGEI